MNHKRLNLLLFAGIIYMNAFGQPTIKAQRVFGGGAADIFTSMDVTRDGGYIVGGSSQSNISGEKTENSRGGTDFWLVKLDSLKNIQWDKTIGTKDYDELNFQETSDGGYMLYGSSYSNISGDKTEKGRGGADYWIVKLDSLGKIQWDKTIGGDKNDNLHSLQQTNDGGYILGGWSYSGISGEKTENNRGDIFTPDCWVVKVDNLGKIQWDKTIGGSAFDDLTVIRQTNDDGYILGCYSASGISGEKTENSRGGSDYWVVRLDKNGNIQWDKTIGGNAADNLTSFQQASDGGYILGGTSSSNKSGEKTEHSWRGYDLWLVKIDDMGEIQWDKTIGTTSGNDFLDIPGSVKLTNDGGCIVGIASDAGVSGNKTESSRGYKDYWIVKISSNGKIQWDKTIGGSLSDYLTSLLQTGDEGYILAGYSFSDISGEKTENNRGNMDYWVVKLNSRGKIQWDKTIGGDDIDGYFGTETSVIVNELGQNRYVVAGSSISEASGDKKRNSRGESDYWLVGLFNKTGSHETVEITQDISGIVSPNTNKVKGFIVYPNPAKNSVTVNYSAQKNGQYIFEITDINGKILLRKQTNALQGSNHTSLDISRFAGGIYFINIIKPDKTKESIPVRKE